VPDGRARLMDRMLKVIGKPVQIRCKETLDGPVGPALAEPGGEMRTILIVDDDPHIRDVVRFALEKAGFQTREAEDGRRALERIAAEPPDLIVLDIRMPELDGTEVCRQLRRSDAVGGQVPIVFLSSKDEEIDRIIGLEIGGDDYVTKPFSPHELVARVRAVLRRLAPDAGRNGAGSADGGGAPTPTTEPAAVLRHGRLCLDPLRFRAHWGEGDGAEEVELTVTEFGVLRTLLAQPGRVFTRDQLMDGAYADHHIVSDRTIDSHVRRVRRKFGRFGADPVETVHGLGYRLGPC